MEGLDRVDRKASFRTVEELLGGQGCAWGEDETGHGRGSSLRRSGKSSSPREWCL